MVNIFTTSVFDDVPIKNPWKGTPIENYYYLSPSAKGSKAEDIVKMILKELGHDVKNRINSGHDCIIDGVKTEIKFGLATDRNYDYETIFNHIGFGKDWDQILFVCINGDGNIASAMYTKDNFPWDAIHRQQGGTSGGNDDFMIAGKNSYNILFNENAIKLI